MFFRDHYLILESCSKEMTEDEKNNHFKEWFKAKVSYSLEIKCSDICFKLCLICIFDFVL